MMAVLLLVPLCLAAGAAVDLSSARSEQANLQQIADGAALAGGRVFDGANLDAAQTAANAFIKGHADRLPTDVAVQMSANGRSLRVTLVGSSVTSLMRIANINSLPITASGYAEASAGRPPAP